VQKRPQQLLDSELIAWQKPKIPRVREHLRNGLPMPSKPSNRLSASLELPRPADFARRSEEILRGSLDSGPGRGWNDATISISASRQ